MDNMDYRALAFWWSIVQGAATGLTVLWVWLTNRQKVNSKAIETMRAEFSKEMTHLDRRLIGVEKDIENIPTHEDMAKVHDRINEANENVMSMSGNLNQISRTVSLIHEHLLNGGGKR